MIKDFNESNIRNIRSSGISTKKLEDFFSINQYPNKNEIKDFANYYQCDETKIKNWFKGKRDRLKKKSSNNEKSGNKFYFK
ncbi:hypothetical protein DDB_G0278225 [Dictyostelium discoideum AX4]|uniref:Homeobox protein 7 n=1 Tax=Dictyostelium discoideum TaxID=44689 RepID=HBX7_DICDI|nr:hypothetical protein DDB_G0278225 [Dictyostelium discoideum AX4]Q54YI1.1 RecName: Full=Homeobox protein 7; Short=DdHbx-7 [Dictyostelium discoideum]EAL68285.1 hypothetical protein DDB_G0278225 [Dictyostelium discoideum AX4]|eukprot:XP_642221.1 hypothetical protein DDB_G0278225 [Dictyostelium discoideum AX4]